MWIQAPTGFWVRIESVQPNQWVLALDEVGLLVVDPTRDTLRGTCPPVHYFGSVPMFEVSASDLPDAWKVVSDCLVNLNARLRAEAERRVGEPGELTALVRCRTVLSNREAFAHVGLLRSNLPLAFMWPDHLKGEPEGGPELPELS